VNWESVSVPGRRGAALFGVVTVGALFAGVTSAAASPSGSAADLQRVRSVTRAMSAHPTQARQIMRRLSRAEQRKVVKYGLSARKQTYAVIPDHGRKRTVRSLGEAAKMLRAAAASDGGGCWDWTVEVEGRSTVQVLLWAFDIRWQWCSDGRVLTSLDTQAYSSYTNYFWKFDGPRDVSEPRGGVGNWYAGRLIEGTFSLSCPWGESCWQSRPTIDSGVYANHGGRWSYEIRR
jgi:hypothetical protein